MKKKLAVLISVCMLFTAVLPSAVFAGENDSEVQEPSVIADADVKDDLVTTKHTAVIQGEEISYTAVTGTMVVETEGVLGEFFYRAYTKDDVEDVSKRPIMFAFNGGPGSCSYYLEMGCLGPRRADVTKDGKPKSLPCGIADNENSLLDITDIVFIDAIGTGYSRPVDESQLEHFIGYENDVRSFGDFIRQYINRNKRWGSEKYIAGESYGTPRAVGICKYLSDTYAIKVNGLMLISSINDFSTSDPDVNNEKPYGLNLPTFAADAWYHKMVDEKYQKMELKEYLEEVKEFVSSEYMPALFLGSWLKDKDRDKLAEKMSSYIGLSKEYILSKNLRITLEDFCSSLLGDKNLMIGCYDGRYTGPIISGSLEDGASDPSSIESDLIYGNTFNEYLTNELNYQTDRPYIPSNTGINASWSFPPTDAGWIGGYFSQEDIIYECLSGNPNLKIWVLCGYYDLATPFYAAEWTYAHIFLNDENKDSISFTHYPSGHMFYLEKNSFDQFRKDAEKWFE